MIVKIVSSYVHKKRRLEAPCSFMRYFAWTAAGAGALIEGALVQNVSYTYLQVFYLNIYSLTICFAFTCFLNLRAWRSARCCSHAAFCSGDGASYGDDHLVDHLASCHFRRLIHWLTRSQTTHSYKLNNAILAVIFISKALLMSHTLKIR